MSPDKMRKRQLKRRRRLDRKKGTQRFAYLSNLMAYLKSDVSEDNQDG